MNKPEKLKEFIDISRSRLKHDPKKVQTFTQLRYFLAPIKKEIKLPKNVTIIEMIKILESANILMKVELLFPSKKYTRYTRGKESIYEIISSLDSNAYYSHLSALFFHGLLEQVPSDIYVNIEQSEKPGNSNAMLQENIKKAFLSPPRITSNVINYQQWRIFLLNGKHTNKTGVINMKGSKKSKTFVTNLERTLIDIVVSPHYSGGVHNVLNVYKKAINKVSINKIFSMLKELNYSYPYHQSIGFYLDNASSITESKIFKESFPMQFDFYLDHKMQKTEYSEKWSVITGREQGQSQRII
jgi:predicted transcriptional regulator of viral defense system